MIFSYWSEEDTSAVAPTIGAWSRHFPEYRMIGDSDVRPILSRMKPGFVDLYDRITIPACRSDVARLAFIHAHGGLYVDCHCHPADPAMIRSLLDGLDTHEMVLMNKDRTKRDKMYRNIFWPRNGVIFARKGSPIIERLLNAAVDNLVRSEAGQPPNIPDKYLSMLQPGEQNVWVLTGPGLYIVALTQDPAQPINIDPAYSDRIKLIEENGPIRLNVHKAYATLVPHWSVQQKSGQLFTAA